MGKKAVLFVMVDDTKNCDEVSTHLEKICPEFQGAVLVIHTKNNGEISEAALGKNKEELAILRRQSNEIDTWKSPFKAIVSVLLLKEGWTFATSPPSSACAPTLPKATFCRSRLWGVVYARVSVDFTSANIEKRHYLYPPAALTQITRNALMHRSYEATNAPVRAYWYDDRIEITNPGGPYGNVTARNFGQPGYADYRNPHIAEAMRVLGLVQRFGVGISIAQAALRDNGNPALQFRVEPTMIFVTLLPAIL